VRLLPGSPFLLSSAPTTPALTSTYPLSLHDALPICDADVTVPAACASKMPRFTPGEMPRSSALMISRRSTICPPPIVPTNLQQRSEAHTSELQSRVDLVCRLLLEKKTRTHTVTQAKH